MTARNRVNSVGALVVAAVLTFATTGQYAFGDNIQNNIVADSISTTVVQGGSVTVTYYVDASGSGGLPGCDATAASPATVTFIVPAGSNIGVSPSSLTFSACDNSGVAGIQNGQSVTFTTSLSTPINLGPGHTITPSVSDTSGAYNVSPGTFKLIVTAAPANTPPQLTVLSDIIEEATGSSGAMVTFTVTATDAEDNPDPTPSCLPASGSSFPLGTTTVNCSVTDSGGLGDSDSFTVTVQDTTAPTLSLPVDITTEATGPSGATVSFSATATDSVDGDVSVDCIPASGSVFSLGATLVSCSATDVAGNNAQGIFNVIVQDTTAPTLALPSDMVVEATGPAGAVVVFSASASDLVDGPVQVDCLPTSGSTFPLGGTTVNCSAEDAAGNSASGSFLITVQDTTPPELTLPDDIIEEATGPGGAVVNFVAAATDLVDGSVSVICNPISGSTFALGTATVECSATDNTSNTATGTFDVTVEDTTPPTLTLPDDMIVEATGPSGATASFAATAYDLVDGSTNVECTPASGSTFALGATPVYCSSEDVAGNIATGSFMVTVVDTTPPSLDLPSGITMAASGISGATVTYLATATDLVDGTVPVDCVPTSGLNFPIGTTTVNCSAEDNAGNVAQGSFSVSITIENIGFYQPVDMNSYVNMAKAGSTVPLKFEVFGDKTVPATEISDVSIVKTLKQKLTSCDPSAPTDEVETTATGGTMLRYDSTAGQFIYNWKTPLQKGCYTVTMTLLDDSTIQALFKLK